MNQELLGINTMECSHIHHYSSSGWVEMIDPTATLFYIQVIKLSENWRAWEPNMPGRSKRRDWWTGIQIEFTPLCPSGFITRVYNFSTATSDQGKLSLLCSWSVPVFWVCGSVNGDHMHSSQLSVFRRDSPYFVVFCGAPVPPKVSGLSIIGDPPQSKHCWWTP